MHKRTWLLIGLVVLALGAATVLASMPADPGDPPDAACKIMPLCDTHADCDAICGEGLGRCVRNKCPIRICRCG